MAIIEFIRNPSFGNSKIDSPIFSRLKIQKESRNPLQDETKFDHLRDELLGYIWAINFSDEKADTISPRTAAPKISK